MLKDKLYLSGEYMNKDESSWDYICRLFNENARYYKECNKDED